MSISLAIGDSPPVTGRERVWLLFISLLALQALSFQHRIAFSDPFMFGTAGREGGEKGRREVKGQEEGEMKGLQGGEARGHGTS